MDPITLLTAFIPLITSTVSRIVGRLTGGPEPQTVSEKIQLMEAETAKLKAMADLDNTPGVSSWVQDLRGALRPVSVLAILGVWAVLLVIPGTNEFILRIVADLASAATLYLFGERTMLYVRRGR